MGSKGGSSSHSGLVGAAAAIPVWTSEEAVASIQVGAAKETAVTIQVEATKGTAAAN